MLVFKFRILWIVFSSILHFFFHFKSIEIYAHGAAEILCTRSEHNYCAYLFEPARSIIWPFFRQAIIGSGDPLGAPHSSIAVSPCATRVFCGSRRKSSRSVATRSVAFWLRATPNSFFASHQYTPASLSRRECVTDKKKRLPDGSSIWWPGSIVSGSPSLYQSTFGSGEPSALQFNVNGLFLGTMLSSGCSIIVGASRPKSEWERRGGKITFKSISATIQSVDLIFAKW